MKTPETVSVSVLIVQLSGGSNQSPRSLRFFGFPPAKSFFLETDSIPGSVCRRPVAGLAAAPPNDPNHREGNTLDAGRAAQNCT